MFFVISFMSRRFFIFTTLYFVMHLMFVCNVRAEDIEPQSGVEIAQQDKLEVVDGEKQAVVADDMDDETDVLYNNQPISMQRRWNIDGYMFLGYGMSFAQPMDINGIDYSSLLRKFQYGFIVGGGVLLNDIYGVGLSFINMRGIDKVSKDDSRFRSIQNAYYMINLDISIIIPIRLFKGRLQFYAIGGVTGLFTDVNNRLKDGVNIDNPGIKFSFGANAGGGIEMFMSRNLSARFEGRYIFLPTSAPLSNFFMTQIMLMLRI